jgi:beta-galactosidase/beta-glucuronidase
MSFPNAITFTVCLIIGSSAWTTFADQWKPAEARLMTRWASDVSADNVLPEYPRPQMVRDTWRNLNGLWDYSITPRGADQPQQWAGKILVPFCIESALSGVGRRVKPDELLCYHRTFTASEPAGGGRLLLHFGAVDWRATVTVNGRPVGSHQGGYDPFTFDITDAVKEGDNELVVSVWDPTDAGLQPRGKQVLQPRGIWYTAVTGIWQTVWLESTPATYVQSIKIAADVERSAFHVSVFGSNEATVKIEVRNGDDAVAQAQGRTGRPISLTIENAQLWSPDSPHLYDLTIELLRDGKVVDRVASYAGLRSIEVRKDHAGINRMYLNGQPLFQYGPLDQGWWPDGLYTAPTDEALRYDVEVTKQLGFNMTRKHVKVEPARWYYWCDKLGLLVWQDMPSSHDPVRGDRERLRWVRETNEEGPELVRTATSAQQYEHELEEIVSDFGNHTSIVVWVPFNERWGQFDTERITALIRRLDPDRLVNAASGGNYLGVGDVVDVHSYPDPSMPAVDDYMAVVCGEFGGLGLPVEGHTLLDKGNWGYRNFDSPQALQAAYLEKLGLLRPLIDAGLAAAVYTQITDVEIEVNGLLTYDRKVIKFDPKIVADANRKLYDSARQTAGPPKEKRSGARTQVRTPEHR